MDYLNSTLIWERKLNDNKRKVDNNEGKEFKIIFVLNGIHQ